MIKSLLKTASLGVLGILAACGSPSSDSGKFRPIDPAVAGFWDRQTTENAELLREIAGEFNLDYDGIPLKVVQSGNYGDIYTKTISAIQAGALPAMVVAYGNMTVEYAHLGAVADLDAFIEDPESGLSESELDDFFPAVLEQNRYPDLGGGTYSFPYTKAVLVLYSNTDVLAKAGLDSPPKTWDEFVEQCRIVKERTGKYALSFDVDPSAINGFVFSMGGKILKDGVYQYGEQPAIDTFRLIDTLFREKLAYQNPPRSFNDQTAFGNDEIAFSFRPSSSRPYYELVKEGLDGWSIAAIPQTNLEDPSTVLYGANISIFNTTDEQMRTAWEFVKYFTSPEVNVRWALKTGYLPYRKSVVDDPDLQAYWAQWPYNRTAFDCLPYAKPEPNVEGWQEVRRAIENATVAVINGLKDPEKAATDLQREAVAIMARNK